MSWNDVPEAEMARLQPSDWLRVAIRGGLVGTLVFGGLVVLLLFRMIERPFFGLHRPVTPVITQFVCRGALRLLGVEYEVEGTPMAHPGAVVSNHASWLDIFALNACQQVYFVSKAEVSKWPFIGWLARATGTVFIRRDRRDAAEQKVQFESRLLAGHRLLFFPEGTSSDGLRILPFKSTLFAAFFTKELKEHSYIQPATITYHAPSDQPDHFYGWWGEMDFAPHLLQTLGARRQGKITVVFHEPLKVVAYSDRKALAQDAEGLVRSRLKLEERSAP